MPRTLAVLSALSLVAGCTAGTPAAPLAASPPTAPRAAPIAPTATEVAPSASVKPVEPVLARPAWNVLVVTVDAMRADMPWAGYPRDIAPTLTAFEKESVSYTRAYAISSYTAMSFGGFLSSRYPSEIRRSGMFFSAYPDSVLMFPELLQRAGVRTLAAQAHFYFDQKAGFRQGFDDYRMVEGIKANNKTDENVTGPQHLALLESMLSDPANTGGRFFAWAHFMDPHDKYLTHEGIDFGKRGRDRYDGEILFTDQQIAHLLEFVGQAAWGERTVVIVSSDHGEAFGEHDRHRHGFEIWEPLVRVPLMIRIPGVAPRRIDVPRSAIDLPRTILELLDVEPDPSFQGRSLVGEIRGAAALEPRDVIVDLPRTSDNDRRRALVYDRYKLLSFGDDFRYELYDIVADPGELHDLARSDKAAFEMMRRRYDERKKTIQDICPDRRDKLMGKGKGREC